MDAQIRRQRTFEALQKLFLRESLNQPLILVCEDLHWIDTETQGFLDTLSESVASAHLLLLVNYRPEYQHEWGTKTSYTQLRLAPLGKAEAEELLTFLLGNDHSLSVLKPLLLEKTEGTPFFMEEVVQTLVEEGALSGVRGNYRLETTPTELHISPTVQGVLAARIDRLTPEEKEVLQELAVIGRQFPVSLAKQVVSQSDTERYRIVASLQAKEFLYEQPAIPEVEYLFKHALTQDVAYGTLLVERRKALHERIGQAMEALYKESLEDHYSELASHYSRSGNSEKAVEYLQLAGQQAVQHSADAEAIRLLTTALELLKTLPDTPGHARQELTLQLTLGPPLMAIKGYGVPEVETTYSRARELCQQVGDAPQLFSALHGLQRFTSMRGDLSAGCKLAEQLISLAQGIPDAGLLLPATNSLLSSLLYQGEFEQAQAQLVYSLSLYDARQQRSQAVQSGLDSHVFLLSYASWLLWQRGYPTQALKRSQEALALAQEIGHPFSQAFALNFAAPLHQMRREVEGGRELAETEIRFSHEHGFPFREAGGRVILGWTMAEQGQRAEGIEQLTQGIAAWRATGARLLLPYYLALLAEAYGRANKAEEELAMLGEAQKTVAATGERFYEAELHRLRGELLLLNDERRMMNDERRAGKAGARLQAAEAEDCFQQALDIARSQRAKSFELRAATSLARLWQLQGKTAEARELLTPVYLWFTEGFETADLKDAKALLDDLSEGV